MCVIYSVFNVKVLVGTLNQEEALVGFVSVIVLMCYLYEPSIEALLVW